MWDVGSGLVVWWLKTLWNWPMTTQVYLTGTRKCRTLLIDHVGLVLLNMLLSGIVNSIRCELTYRTSLSFWILAWWFSEYESYSCIIPSVTALVLTWEKLMTEDVMWCCDWPHTSLCSYLARYGQSSFYISGSSLWNSLPLTVRDSSLTLTQFCTRLKTFLFTRAYGTSP